MHYQSAAHFSRGLGMVNSPEDHPVKKVMISAVIVVVIVGLMIGLMILGEMVGNWL
jgi:hypothetical protein